MEVTIRILLVLLSLMVFFPTPANAGECNRLGAQDVMCNFVTWKQSSTYTKMAKQFCGNNGFNGGITNVVASSCKAIAGKRRCQFVIARCLGDQPSSPPITPPPPAPTEEPAPFTTKCDWTTQPGFSCQFKLRNEVDKLTAMGNSFCGERGYLSSFGNKQLNACKGTKCDVIIGSCLGKDPSEILVLSHQTVRTGTGGMLLREQWN
jgi:hypothetical protein